MAEQRKAEYRVIVASNALLLEERVNEELLNGLLPTGGVSMVQRKMDSAVVWAQAMIRKERLV